MGPRNLIVVLTVALLESTATTLGASTADAATPTVSVQPSSNLPYRGFVTVHGTNLPAHTALRATECGVGPTDSACQDGTTGTTDSSGSIDLTVPFRRKLVQLITVNENGAVLGHADCLQTGTQCSIRLSLNASPFTQLVSAPITFNAAAPVPAPPTLVVTPSTDLAARPIVGIQGSGYFPNHVVDLSQCRAGTTVFSTELCSEGSTTVADATGHISTIAIVRRWSGAGLSVNDCALSPACTFRATTDASTFYLPDPTEVARVPLDFDPSTTFPPGPPVSVTPKTGLTDRQAVAVAGSGFPGGDRIAIVPCRNAATFTPGDCDTTAPVTFLADGNGAFSQPYSVPQFFLPGRSGTVDCGTSTPTCVLAIVDYDDSTIATFIPVTFATHGPNPVATIRSRAITEPTGASHSTKIDIQLSVATDHYVEVRYEVPFPETGTATLGDYSNAHGIATFAPGQTLVSVRVDIVGDSRDEPDQWFALHLADTLGATAGPDARITIKDDDPPPSVRIADTTVREQDAVRYALVPVRLSVGSEFPITVHYATHQFTARAGSDYVDTTGTLTIPPYWTEVQIAVVVVGDNVHESKETLLVAIDTPNNATIADGDAVLTITDDD